MKEIYLKHFYIVIIVILFFLPLAQMKYKVFEEIKLAGVEYDAKKPELSWKKIFTGETQTEFEKWFAQNIGLRGWMVKTNNQLYYSLFRAASPELDVIIVKKDEFLVKRQIEDYLTIKPAKSVGELEAKIIKMKKVQNILKEKGMAFLLLLTPNKTSVYPEYIPGFYNSENRRTLNNYEKIIPLLEKHQVDFIDGKNVLLDVKNEAGKPVFGKGGAHWNGFGVFCVAKKIIDKLEKVCGKDLTELEVDTIVVDDNPDKADYELVDLMNIWFADRNYETQHVKPIEYEDENKFRPDVVVLGGSFNWSMNSIMMDNQIYNSIDFYYYYSSLNKYLSSGEMKSLGKTWKMNWEEDVFKKDLIILEVNEEHIPVFDNGFCEDILDAISRQ